MWLILLKKSKWMKKERGEKNPSEILRNDIWYNKQRKQKGGSKREAARGMSQTTWRTNKIEDEAITWRHHAASQVCVGCRLWGVIAKNIGWTFPTAWRPRDNWATLWLMAPPLSVGLSAMARYQGASDRNRMAWQANVLVKVMCAIVWHAPLLPVAVSISYINQNKNKQKKIH